MDDEERFLQKIIIILYTVFRILYTQFLCVYFFNNTTVH